ncbi:MAG: hypothetical protein JNJ41_13490 [Bacteroidia bacterium]|nr:hypothetical protein [Bacteroidia bacterium]
MRAIIILGFGVIAQVALSQQQQQMQQVFVNNISNINIQYRGNLSNNANVKSIQTNISQVNNRAVQSQQLASNTLKARPTQQYTQVKVTNTNKNPVTAQVRRANPRPRPRLTNAIPVNVNPPQNVDVNNVLEANQVLGNEFNPVVQTINFINNDDLQVQNFSNVTNEGVNPFSQLDNINVGAQINFNLDLSLNLKGKSNIRSRSSASSSSSSHSKSRSFSKKMAKLKRNFFGKLSSHKKGKHRLDVCFAWKN